MLGFVLNSGPLNLDRIRERLVGHRSICRGLGLGSSLRLGFAARSGQALFMMKSLVPPRLINNSAGRFLPPGLFAVLLLFIIAMPSVARYTALLPPCGMRTLTGLPCPLCGSTRALLALSHGHPLEAFLLNPLFCLACAALGGWFILWFVDRLFQHDSQAVVVQWAGSLPHFVIMVAATLLNWLYLCFGLPR